MRNANSILFVTATLIMLLMLSTWSRLNAKDVDPADTIYTNGKIYTVDNKQPWAEAVAIKDGKFIAVGKNKDIRKLKGNKTELIDLGGDFVMPGIVDTHLHLSNVYGAQMSGELLFPESLTPKQIQKTVREYIGANPERKFVRANKYGLGQFPQGRATKEFLDEISTDIPIMIIDETGHNAAVNSKALEIAGITKDTPDPFGGSIHRNANGEPSGYLSESAMGLVGRHFPRFSTEARYQGLLKAMPAIHPFGITSFRDPMCAEEVIEAYRRLEKEGKLKFRIDLSVLYDDFAAEVSTSEEYGPMLEKAQKGAYNTELISVNSVKFFSDGTPLSKTSLLVDPYPGTKDDLGTMLLNDRVLKEIKGAHLAGLTTVHHVTGDGTVRVILDAIEDGRKQKPLPKLYHHFAHATLIHPDDIQRVVDLKVGVEFSPVALTYPSPLSSLGHKAVGPQRARRWVPLKALADAGALLAHASDWPAGTPDADPWRGLQAYVTREDPTGLMDGKAGEGISIETGIKMLTLNGAVMIGKDDKTGSIEVGKYADFIVLDRNLLETKPKELAAAKVLKTVFGGERVFDRKAATDALNVVDIKITNKNLDNAVDAAELDVLVSQEVGMMSAFCGAPATPIGPGAKEAPQAVNKAFADLAKSAQRFVRPAREIYSKNADAHYWIQWTRTQDDEGAILWAYDPGLKRVVEVLRVSEKE